MGNKNAIPGKVSGIPQADLPPGLRLLNTSISSTNTYTSSTFNASNLDNVGLQVTFTGTPTGTLTVNCSVDNTNFYALTFNPALAQPAGDGIAYLINLNQLPFPYLQVSYTNASGSGTLVVYLSAKDLN